MLGSTTRKTGFSLAHEYEIVTRLFIKELRCKVQLRIVNSILFKFLSDKCLRKLDPNKDQEKFYHQQ